MRIAIVGSGGWGLALARLLARRGQQVTVWSRRPETTALLRRERRNEQRLPGVLLPEGIDFTDELSQAADCPLVVLATPSYAVRETCLAMAPFLKAGQGIVLLSKGFDLENGCCLLSETVEQAVGKDCPIVVLTGPSHAEEVSRGVPTAVVAACPQRAAAELVQRELSDEALRIYTSPDRVSAQLGGAMKNIMAMAVGVSDGYGFGDNTKAMLMTRGIAEMSRLGVMLGGREETFAGLSGVGDLIVTCISQHSRNRRAGLLIGGGLPAERALEQVGAVVEGYYAAKAVHLLAGERGVSMPICQGMYRILFEGAPVKTVAEELLHRAGRTENSAVAWQ